MNFRINNENFTGFWKFFNVLDLARLAGYAIIQNVIILGWLKRILAIYLNLIGLLNSLIHYKNIVTEK